MKNYTFHASARVNTTHRFPYFILEDKNTHMHKNEREGRTNTELNGENISLMLKWSKFETI